MIVGTAGHIDHGKTTLVRALTGVDTDRLPEEKKRGISIELGYAYLDVDADAGAGAERIGFIDVPGHEKLVSTMLAGATGIDFALLLIAADDGVMPQTEEHLAALSLLGVRRGAIVVTKADRVATARVDEVSQAARSLIAGTTLQGSDVFAVSATTGVGVDALRGRLLDASRVASATRDGDAGFRLAVDRVFTIAGTGTVVTGTAHAGRVAIGDELLLAPNASGLRARVRSIHAQNASVERATAGQRVALGLVGIEKTDIERGDWLVAPRIALATERLDVRLEVWRKELKALRSGAIVHVHVGASETMASVAVLDLVGTPHGSTPGSPARHDSIPAGEVGRVQLVVLRDANASRTIAGGVVLDPFAPARYRRTPQRLSLLDGMEHPGARRRLAAALDAAPEGVDLETWQRAEGSLVDVVAATSQDEPGRLPAGSTIARRGDVAWALSAAHATAWRDKIVAALAAFHRDRADEPGPEFSRLRRLAGPRLAETLWREVLASAVSSGAVEAHGAQLSLPGHAARLSAAEQRLVEKVAPKLLAGAFDPPWVRALAADLREPEAVIRNALQRASQRGEMHQVVKDLYYPPATLSRAAAMVREIAGRDGAVSAASFRDASGLGRKRAIQIVEYFDRVGLLRRVGDVHRLRTDCELFGAPLAAAP